MFCGQLAHRGPQSRRHRHTLKSVKHSQAKFPISVPFLVEGALKKINKNLGALPPRPRNPCCLLPYFIKNEPQNR